MLETFQFATSRLAGSLLIAMRKGSRNSSPRQFRHRRPASHDRHVKSRPRRMNAITAAADPGNQARRGPATAVKARTATAFLPPARLRQQLRGGPRAARQAWSSLNQEHKRAHLFQQQAVATHRAPATR